MFDSFRKLHTRALLIASFEIFEIVFGPYIGRRIWRYAERREFKSGEFLCREGHMNNTLYLLQCGKVTSITKAYNGVTKRLSSMRRGAFFNEECLFMERPVSHSCFVEEDSVVWVIDRKSLNDLKINDPFLAAEIFRYIMRCSFRTRHAGLNTFKEKTERKDPSEGLGLSIISQIPCFDQSSESGYKTPPSEHLTPSENLEAGLSPKGGSRNLLMTLPHLSGSMRLDAVDCFLYHSFSEDLGQITYSPKAAFQARRYSSGDLDSPLENKSWKAIKKNSRSIDDIIEKNKNRRISQNQLQKALMDLGFFPTVAELQLMRKS
jgi:hypothetical protein